ncbi:hypothetical protein PILCRDRAFT_471986 [Piloderma croceum F 1598]|uniref:Amidohydrolase-related domain-containing protein n=1 Tax=Piloderma croceum (strain F 1598) TaxID=765440 RepID=A0A0C3BXY6_PILCF|nr:hypothetical protein PILCRDRAFT_471986 [Piloderma croceum F 1598]
MTVAFCRYTPDYRFRSRLADDSAVVGPDELEVIIDTAHSYGVKLAAHATNHETIKILLLLNIDSIEHDYCMYLDEALSNLFQPSSKWVPILSAYHTMSDGQDDGPWRAAKQAFKQAIATGMDKIACGGDTGVFSHGDNALEMKLTVKLGADWRMLRWCTLGGWECIWPMGWEGEQGRDRLKKHRSASGGCEGCG